MKLTEKYAPKHKLKEMKENEMKTYKETLEYMKPARNEMEIAIQKRKHWEEQCETGTDMHKYLKHEEDKAEMEFYGMCEAVAFIYDKDAMDVFREE